LVEIGIKETFPFHKNRLKIYICIWFAEYKRWIQCNDIIFVPVMAITLDELSSVIIASASLLHAYRIDKRRKSRGSRTLDQSDFLNTAALRLAQLIEDWSQGIRNWNSSTESQSVSTTRRLEQTRSRGSSTILIWHTSLLSIFPNVLGFSQWLLT